MIQRTRSFSVNDHRVTSSVKHISAFLPILDLLNHRPDVVHWFYNYTTDMLQFSNTISYSPGEEVIKIQCLTNESRFIIVMECFQMFILLLCMDSL